MQSARLGAAVAAGIATRGDDYELSSKEGDKAALAGKRVLIISADGPELPELDVPLEYLKARGAQVELAGQSWIFQYRWPNDGSKNRAGW